MGHQRRVRRGPDRPDLSLRSRGNAQRITRSTGARRILEEYSVTDEEGIAADAAIDVVCP